MVVFYPLRRIFHFLNVAEEQDLECQQRDLVVLVLEVDKLVVEHVLVDLAVQVFWIVRVVVVEVLGHLVEELDLLWMVVKVLVV